MTDCEFDSLLELASASQARLWQEQEVYRCSAIQSLPLTGTLVSSGSEITKLSNFVGSLASEPGMLHPNFFLASVLPKNWRPSVVLVSQGSRTAGLLYYKERVVAGIGTRIAVGHDDLGTMVVASPAERESIIRCGLEALLRQMIGVRLLVAPDCLSVLKSFSGAADIKFCSASRHSHLELPRTYDDFLMKAGPLMRRNLRYYRRKSERAGNEFISELTFSDFSAAAGRLFPKAAYRKSKRKLERCLAMVEAMPSRMLVGLKRRAGEWIGLAGGWYTSNGAIMNLQLNDCTCTRESVSLVLRSYLIETLIKRGARELVFWGGTSAPLSFLCTTRELFMVYIDAPSLPWRLFRSLCATISKLAPRSFSKDSELAYLVPRNAPNCTEETVPAR
jgi:hypothetical protein